MSISYSTRKQQLHKLRALPHITLGTPRYASAPRAPTQRAPRSRPLAKPRSQPAMCPANAAAPPPMILRYSRALRARTYGADTKLDSRAEAFVSLVLTHVADGLERDPNVEQIDALAAVSYDLARDSASLASATHHEAWGRAALLFAARDAARLADADPSYLELRDCAERLAYAADARIAPRGGTGAIKLHAIDDVTRAARKALADAREKALPSSPLRIFGSALFEQLGAALPMLAARGAKPGPVVANAVRNADDAARRHLAKQNITSVTERRALAVRALYEASALFAASALDALDVTTERDDAALWLLRASAAITATAKNAHAWLPDDPTQTPQASVTAANGTQNSQQNTSQNGTQGPARAPTPPPVVSTLASRGHTEPVMKESPTNNTAASAMHPMLKTLQTDATDAAWRTAGSQLLKLTREPLIGLLTRHLAPGDDAFRARLAAFLDTELGGALLASTLSLALSALPATSGEIPQKLARELRVRAMSDTGDLVADVLMGPLRQVIALYLQDPANAVAASPLGLPEADPRATLAGTFQNSAVGAPVNGPSRG